MRRFELPALTENAARIFTGVCHSAKSVIVDGRIATRYVFSVRRIVKGEQLDEIDFIVAGGELNGERSHIAGMPRFRRGEEVVLFLTREDRLGRVWPVGLAQGKLRVHRGASGDEVPRVYQDGATASLSVLPVGADGAAKPVSTHDPVNGLTLAEFLARVQALVDSPDAPPTGSGTAR